MIKKYKNALGPPLNMARAVDMQRTFPELGSPARHRWGVLYQMSVKSPGWVLLHDFIRVFNLRRGGVQSIYSISQIIHRRLLRDEVETRDYEKKRAGWRGRVKIVRIVDLKRSSPTLDACALTRRVCPCSWATRAAVA